MPALTISLGGKMDSASIKGAFSGAELEARASASRINGILQKEITALKRDADKMQPGTYYRRIIDDQIVVKQEALNKLQTAQFRAAALERIKIAEMEAAAKSLAAQKESALVRAAESRKAADRYSSTGVQRKGSNLQANLLAATNTLADLEADSGTSAVAMAAGRKGKADAIRAVRAYNAQFARGGSFKGLGGLGTPATMLISVARDTAAQLATPGASVTRIFFQQFPQIAQAATMVKGGFGGMVKALAEMKVVGGLTLGVLAGGLTAVGVVAGSVWYYFKRVNDMVKDMVGPMREAFSVTHIAKYLQKAGLMENLQKDITAEVRRTKEAHDSVTAVLDRQLALTKDRISFERELLELQKANELAGAKTAAQREAIEKKYSASIIAKKKEERDAELAHLKELTTKLPEEIKKTKAELEQATSGGYISEEQDAKIQAKRDKAAAEAEAYQTKGTPDGFSLEKDRATIAALDKEKRLRQSIVNENRPEHNWNPEKAASYIAGSEADAQRRATAEKRMADMQRDIDSANEWSNSRRDRTDQQDRVNELRDKIKADEKRLAELGDGKSGEIADKEKANLQRDKEDLRLEEERLRRTDQPGSGGHSSAKTEWERAGAWLGGPQISLLNETVAIRKELGAIHNTIKNPGKVGGTAGRKSPWGGGKK